MLRNNSDWPITIKRGEKIAQILLLKEERLDIEVVEEGEVLAASQRGEGAFGSSDKQ